MFHQIIEFLSKSKHSLLILALGLLDFIYLLKSKKKITAIIILVFILVVVTVRFMIFLHPEKAEFTGTYIEYSYMRRRNSFVFDTGDQTPHKIFYTTLREAQFLQDRLLKGANYTFSYETRSRRIYVDTIIEAD